MLAVRRRAWTPDGMPPVRVFASFYRAGGAQSIRRKPSQER
uniref:Uncharacterized protein n=1 Tax=Siphoviridae sp. ctpyK9 TaxID=2825679 RepID=A0A8S5UUB9_9CAUD|nr:MAG TPA: hypothetical protein [Siphoviridae sp. ctpyK9]DAI78297.1 MAG TPA: hypothetical protein [Caudoviricetes sp.]